jgi:CHAT domain-containing protein
MQAESRLGPWARNAGLLLLLTLVAQEVLSVTQGLVAAGLLLAGPFLFRLVVGSIGAAIELLRETESDFERSLVIHVLVGPIWACVLVFFAVLAFVEVGVGAVAMLPVALLIRRNLLIPAAFAAFAAAALTGWSLSLLALAFLLSGRVAWHFSARPPKLWYPLPTVGWRTNPKGWLRLRRCDRRIRRGDFLGARTTLERSRRPGAHHRLRLAFLDLEERSYQRALALDPAVEGLRGELATFATLLRGQALSGIAQFDTAGAVYDSLLEAQSSTELFDPYVRVLQAENAVAAGYLELAREVAETARSQARGRRGYFLRLRASYVLAEIAIEDSTDSVGFEKRIDEADEILLADRWTRRVGLRPDPIKLVRQLFGRRGNLILHQVRVEVLRHRAEPEDESGWDAEPVGLAMAIAGWADDLVEVLLTEADIAARDDRHDERTRLGVRALMELDATRYRLAAQSARTSWSRRFQRALGVTLDAAHREENHTLVAELLEFARIQGLPATTAESSGGDLALSIPPVVRLRDRARLVRPAEADRPPPVSLETAIGRAAGAEGWWLSFWEADEWLYWSLIPPAAGDIESGRIPLGGDSTLARALVELEESLPLLRSGEDPASADFRIARSPLLADPAAERRLSALLGSKLIPESLLAAARRCDQRGERLSLAIAPSPSLGYVPWGILAARRETSDEVDRLLELCDWVIAPSAALLVQAPERDHVDPAPLALAVADTIETPELGALEGARRQASALPAEVTVLGGRHWSPNPATVAAIEATLVESGSGVTIAFLCHALRGTPEEPSRGGLVIAAQAPGGEEHELLGPIDIFAMTARGVAMPSQVLLQACDTSALSDASSGEWLTLAPALVAGGSREVVATLYPMPDLYIPEDPVIEAAVAGTSLRQAVVLAQRIGLARWEAGQADDPAHSPLSWGAYAPICVGPSRSAEPAPQVAGLVSARFIRVLSKAIEECRQGRSERLDSGYLLSALFEDSDIAEMFDGASDSLRPSTFVWTLAPYVLSRFLRFRDGPTRELVLDGGARIDVSEILGEAFPRAVQTAERDGMLIEPEYLLQEVLGQKSAARRILQVLSKVSRRPFELTRRAIDHNLAQTIAQGQKRAQDAESWASEEELLARAFVAESLGDEGPTVLRFPERPRATAPD